MNQERVRRVDSIEAIRDAFANSVASSIQLRLVQQHRRVCMETHKRRSHSKLSSEGRVAGKEWREVSLKSCSRASFSKIRLISCNTADLPCSLDSSPDKITHDEYRQDTSEYCCSRTSSRRGTHGPSQATIGETKSQNRQRSTRDSR